jgi:putative restriction endonuclease
MSATAMRDGELLRREVIAAALHARAEMLGGSIHLEELSDFQLPDGSRLRLIDGGGGGIWNPRDFEATLAITTSADGPYQDREAEGGLLHYAYQRGSIQGKNAKLRRALELRLPVIRFTKVRPNYYMPTYPVWVIDDNPIIGEFTLALDEQIRSVPTEHEMSPIEKAYAARLVRQRVHQPAFRAQVMLAYDRQCAVCVLKHVELLDAAHIIEDGDSWGDAIITNGLSLCKIHHAAYDRKFLGISPDYTVHINQRLLDEVDGPMLKHGLQEMNGRVLHLPQSPRDRPDRDRLAARFEVFRSA